ncbi:Uncharacterized protein FKW44_020792 [Caligus rogercresseyi]|uniref:Uncharacterized protein n=1 Tax=Caligus rogercresseyi TaxID=217165 RepID=A0A7T8GQQ6_CALRO|nr:Uncharacterized protein FKW44_020792 [Caligus rogercresseyi]
MDTGFYIAEACGDADDTTVHYGKERHFANLQVIAVVGSDGQKCDLIFLEDGQRLNSFTYVEFLRRKVFPWARATYGDHGGFNMMVQVVIHLSLPSNS